MTDTSPQDLDWEHLARGCVHRIKVAIFVALGESPIPLSANNLRVRALPEDKLSNVAYHLKKMDVDGVVRKTHETPVRGAIEKFYVLNRDGNRSKR